MADYRLSKTQRNEVYETAVRLGLDPASFRWETEENLGGWGNVGHRVVHPGTGAFLRIIHADASGFDEAHFSFDYWPKTTDLEDVREDDWRGLRATITVWMEAVKAEVDAPDLWQVAQEERAWLAGTQADFGGNAPFTNAEREQIAIHLRTIEEYTIKTYHLEAAHQAHVREQLHYLTEAANRVGRFDWKNLAASTFINIVLTLGLDIEKAQGLLALATKLLGPLVVGVTRLLSP